MLAIRKIWRRVQVVWWMARQISGDAAYENYVRCARKEGRTESAAGPPMSPESFYVDSLRRRYSQASRCC